MPDLAGDSLSTVLANAVWLTLLPLLLVCYAGQFMRVRRIRSEFSLRRFESIELDRAIQLHNRVSQRLTELKDRDKPRSSRRSGLHRLAEAAEQHSDELEDLEAHAEHLQMTILRLSRRPLQRLRFCLHVKSLQFAFGEAIQTYLMSFASLLVITFVFFDGSGSGDEFGLSGNDALILYALDAASALAVAAVPAFYMIRWFSLRRQYSMEFCVLKELAHAGPVQLIEEPLPEAGTLPLPADDKRDCFAVLGVANSATVEEIRQAYKTLIKQNHPDRVHNMSPALRKFAESQTQMINTAYQQALTAVPMH
jgi:DnaJ-domain-containing protein 1